MVKKKVGRHSGELTKGQLSLWQRQRKKQRLFLVVGISVIIIALGTVIGGWLTQNLKLQQTVIRVNETEFNMDYYLETLKIYSHGLPPEYMVAEYMLLVADDAARRITENELIKQGAMELGISVTDSEAENALEKSGLPSGEGYRDWIRAELLPILLADRHFEKEVPVSTEQRHIMAMFLESEARATEVRNMLEEGESFTELAGEFTLENFSKQKEGDLDWKPEGILTVLALSSILDENAFELREGELSQPVYDEEKVKDVGYWLIKVLEREEDVGRAHVQAILLGDEDTAYEVRSKLEAGEDFAKVSFENTEANETGGDFGWLTPGTSSAAFDEFVFGADTELGVVSEPIRDSETITEGGYWLIKVVELDDDKEIAEEDRAVLKALAYNDWVADLWENSEVDDSHLDYDKKLWAVERVLSDLN